MSDTPKTDAAASDGWSGMAICVDVEFAREQERAINELVAAAQLADCTCSVAERHSGHRTECWMPEFLAAIAKATGEA